MANTIRVGATPARAQLLRSMLQKRKGKPGVALHRPQGGGAAWEAVKALGLRHGDALQRCPGAPDP
eukprot:6167079-Alexandrium_andersonii.AAC.1